MTRLANPIPCVMQVSDDLLKTYLDSYQQTPWAALRYLVAEANYGGRVTDELDRRVLNSYMNNFYTEEALSVPDYALSPLPEYHIPQTSTIQGFKVRLSIASSREPLQLPYSCIAWPYGTCDTLKKVSQVSFCVRSLRTATLLSPCFEFVLQSKQMLLSDIINPPDLCISKSSRPTYSRC